MSFSQCFHATHGGTCGDCSFPPSACFPTKPIAPPAAVNDAAMLSGSGQVRAAGGAPKFSPPARMFPVVDAASLKAGFYDSCDDLHSMEAVPFVPCGSVFVYPSSQLFPSYVFAFATRIRDGVL